jgi:hypothetical protein
VQVFRSKFAQASAVVTALVLLAVLAGIWASEGFWSFAVSVPPVALVVFVVAILYFYPRVEVDEGGVRIVNVVRTHYVSWGAIEVVDTKYALSIQALGKKYTAWGAPAPGRHSAIFASRDQGQHLPESTYLAGTVRPGDLVTSESGAAAAHIRRNWEQRRENPGAAHVASSWHFRKLIGLAALVVASAFVL